MKELRHSRASRCLAIFTLSFFISCTSLRGDSLDLPENSYTQRLFGRAPFALLHPDYSCRAYQQSTEGIGNYGIAVLWNTFGLNFDCFDQELQNPRVKLVEVHLINAPCIRNAHCEPYEIVYGYTEKSFAAAVDAGDKKLKNKIQSAARGIANYLLPRLQSDVQCFINPVLETNLERTQSVKVQRWIAPYFSNRCSFVWNPEGGNPGEPIPGAAVSEGHGPSPSFHDDRCIANPDGTSISGVEAWTAYFKKYKNCVAVLGWTRNDNCRSVGEPWTDPRKRKCADTSEFANVRKGIIAAKSSE